MRIALVFMLLIGSAFAAPWLGILFGNYGSTQQNARRQGKGGKERWKEICRTISPDPFSSRLPDAGLACPF